MPRITAATVAENREQRRDALLEAAARLMEQQGGFTVAEVAREVGLSRSAVYEYYSSAAELIADVLIDELAAWSASLATAAGTTTEDRVDVWLRGVLAYAADGRHALVRAAGTIELPASRRARVQALHQDLVAPLVESLDQGGHRDSPRLAAFIWGVVEVAIARIETGQTDGSEETEAAVSFVRGALEGTD